MTDLFQSILNGIYHIIGNYGWAVIVFSVLIKAVLLPLDIKSRKSMRAMSLLNPQMEALKKRYANDQEKLNQKMSELYKKNKVNPLSGCLPLLIQMPILFIMFAAMRNAAAELQLNQMAQWIQNNMVDANGSFFSLDSSAIQVFLEDVRMGGAVEAFSGQNWLWVKNVFQPDVFSRTMIPTVSELQTLLGQYKAIAAELPILGQYVENADLANAVDLAVRSGCGYTNYPLFLNFTSINFPSIWNTYVNGVCALPLLACLTQLLSTKLQPAAEQNAGAQNGTGAFMKWFFPLFSLWICWSSTAAFAIYWVFVNVWSIATNFVINKVLEKQESKTASAVKEELNP